VTPKRYLILSILAHGLLFWGSSLLQEPASHNTAIEVAFTGAAKESAHSKISHAPSRVAKVPQKSIDFGMSTTNAITQAYVSPPNPGANQATDNSLDSSGGISFDPYGDLEMPEIRFVQSLWREIDKAIINPTYLSEYGHFGKVFFVFDVDPDGNLIESSIRVQAEDRVLKVIAARAIRKAVLNINGELPKPRHLTKISSTFVWSDYQTCKSHRGSGKNTLSFCNYAEDKRKRFTAGEKAATYVDALKYGFGAIEEIQKYNREEMRRNTQFNPFQEFERDPDWNLGT